MGGRIHRHVGPCLHMQMPGITHQTDNIQGAHACKRNPCMLFRGRRDWKQPQVESCATHARTCGTYKDRPHKTSGSPRASSLPLHESRQGSTKEMRPTCPNPSSATKSRHTRTLILWYAWMVKFNLAYDTGKCVACLWMLRNVRGSKESAVPPHHSPFRSGRMRNIAVSSYPFGGLEAKHWLWLFPFSFAALSLGTVG